MAHYQQEMIDADNDAEALKVSPDTFHLTLMVIQIDVSTQLRLDNC